MRYGLYVANFGEASYAKILADLAVEAEECGWDGFFLWDHILHDRKQRSPMVDPWIALTSIATRTKRIKIGTTITPLPRRRPWKLARETVSLDHLSGGRLILGVGMGFPPDAEYENFGEESDNKVRAGKLDEGLEVLTGLWRGRPFSYDGEYYHIQKTVFLPPAKQAPRIPIWVGGIWPSKAPFRRAASWDGMIPLMDTDSGLPEPQDIRAVLSYVRKHRRSGAGRFDVAVVGWTTGTNRTKDIAKVASYEKVGTTWWLESLYMARDSPDKMRKRIRQGPPKP